MLHYHTSSGSIHLFILAKVSLFVAETTGKGVTAYLIHESVLSFSLWNKFPQWDSVYVSISREEGYSSSIQQCYSCIHEVQQQYPYCTDNMSYFMVICCPYWHNIGSYDFASLVIIPIFLYWLIMPLSFLH